MTVTAKEFRNQTETNDTLIARNSKGHEWNGDVQEVTEDSNGTLFPFADNVIVYHEPDDTLYFAPKHKTAISAGILSAIQEVENTTKGITWKK